jgi:hypothetical protein
LEGYLFYLRYAGIFKMLFERLFYEILLDYYYYYEYYKINQKSIYLS